MAAEEEVKEKEVEGVEEVSKVKKEKQEAEMKDENDEKRVHDDNQGDRETEVNGVKEMDGEHEDWDTMQVIWGFVWTPEEVVKRNAYYRDSE